MSYLEINNNVINYVKRFLIEDKTEKNTYHFMCNGVAALTYELYENPSSLVLSLQLKAVNGKPLASSPRPTDCSYLNQNDYQICIE